MGRQFSAVQYITFWKGALSEIGVGQNTLEGVRNAIYRYDMLALVDGIV